MSLVRRADVPAAPLAPPIRNHKLTGAAIASGLLTALRLNIVSGFNYTIEMLIQAGRKRMAVASVPIAANQVTRKSRLFKSVPNFIKRSVATMLRIYAMHQPLKVFAIVGGEGHIQSLIPGALVIIAVVSFVIGLVADLIGFDRQLLEITLEKVREMELKLAPMEDDRRTALRVGFIAEMRLAKPTR